MEHRTDLNAVADANGDLAASAERLTAATESLDALITRVIQHLEAQHNELMAEHRALRARDRHAAGGSDD